MLKIGEFSKLSMLTVKTLRFYEEKGVILPAYVDEWTGYRYYEMSQLIDAARVRFYRQLGLTIDEIRSIRSGSDSRKILESRARAIENEKHEAEKRLAAIRSVLEGNYMNYQVNEKTIGEMIVYSSETVLKKYSDMMRWIPEQGEECLKINPGLECADVPYEFCEYLDGEYKETDVRIRHSEAVKAFGNENEHIKFRKLPETKVLSVYHKGAYDNIGDAYAFIMKYASDNGYTVDGLARECYIDGIWNKESVDDWLTEIQLPVA